MWYIFSQDKALIATCDGKPNLSDLASRNEFAVESDLDIPFDKVAIDSNGKIIAKE